MSNSSEILDNEETLRRLDSGGMLSVVSRMPEMIEQAQRFSCGISFPKAVEKTSQIIILGLGGSAIAGDMVADLIQKKTKVPIITCRHYFPPEYTGPNTLVFVLSYSGDTEETLSAFQEAEKRKANIICITSGGKLKVMAEAKKYPLILIPTGYQPRAALPYLLIPLLISLEKLAVTSSMAEGIRESTVLLQKLREEWGFARATRSNLAKQLARKLLGKIPLIFGSCGTTTAAALRFKNQLNENSKMTAMTSVFPELNHNEIVGLAALKREKHDFALIILRDEADIEQIKKRIEITKSLISRQMGGAHEVISQGKSPLARLLSLVFFGDFVSVYLALLKGVDPTPVEVIARLKREVRR